MALASNGEADAAAAAAGAGSSAWRRTSSSMVTIVTGMREPTIVTVIIARGRARKEDHERRAIVTVSIAAEEGARATDGGK